MLRALVLAVVLLALPTQAVAQVAFEVLGSRALGMGGAFVAVADDSTAFHWNPAGQATGSPVGMTVGWDHLRFGNPDLPAVVGSAQDSNALTSVSSWPFGVSYGYFTGARVVAIQTDGTPIVQSLRVHHLGFTVLQTLVKGLVVGTTVKYLRGTPTIGDSASVLAGDVLSEAMNQEGPSDGAFDLDIGVMGTMGPVRVGLTIKNVLEPTFTGSAGFETQLKRRFRMGIAVLPTDGLTLAFDADLDTADPLVGLRRMLAVGGEIHLGSSMALRSGIRWSRDGARQPIAAVGASIRLHKGLWLDGYASYSRVDDRGYGVAFRAGS